MTIDGQFSHALRKHAVLRPGEVAPIRDDALQAAEAMYDPELVIAGSATDAEVETAASTWSAPWNGASPTARSTPGWTC